MLLKSADPFLERQAIADGQCWPMSSVSNNGPASDCKLLSNLLACVRTLCPHPSLLRHAFCKNCLNLAPSLESTCEFHSPYKLQTPIYQPSNVQFNISRSGERGRKPHLLFSTQVFIFLRCYLYYCTLMSLCFRLNFHQHPCLWNWNWTWRTRGCPEYLNQRLNFLRLSFYLCSMYSRFVLSSPVSLELYLLIYSSLDPTHSGIISTYRGVAAPLPHFKLVISSTSEQGLKPCSLYPMYICLVMFYSTSY